MTASTTKADNLKGLDRAYQQGADAFAEGKTAEQNPYIETAHRAAWENGWQGASKNAAHLAQSASSLSLQPSSFLPTPSAFQRVDLQRIQIAGTQTRAGIHADTVREYADSLSRGEQFPPVILFDDGQELWLADGFHRFHAHREFGLPDILAEVRQGSWRDAVLHGAHANDKHGLRRTNEDKRACVLLLLKDKEWRRLGNKRIAEMAGVTEAAVCKIRQQLEADGDVPIIRDGREIKTELDPEVLSRRIGGHTFNLTVKRATKLEDQAFEEFLGHLVPWAMKEARKRGMSFPNLETDEG